MVEISDHKRPAATTWLYVDLSAQRLTLMQGDRSVCHWPVSTAAKGAGELRGSGCTPRGWHKIRLKIGENGPVNGVFVGRRPTGELWSAALAAHFPQRDWILTRILWLSGLEPGRNRGGERDTLRRFIYIHGTPDDQPLGIAASHGCIRMHSRHLLALFALVEVGTRVLIEAPQQAGMSAENGAMACGLSQRRSS